MNSGPALLGAEQIAGRPAAPLCEKSASHCLAGRPSGGFDLPDLVTMDRVASPVRPGETLVRELRYIIDVHALFDDQPFRRNPPAAIRTEMRVL